MYSIYPVLNATEYVQTEQWQNWDLSEWSQHLIQSTQHSFCQGRRCLGDLRTVCHKSWLYIWQQAEYEWLHNKKCQSAILHLRSIYRPCKYVTTDAWIVQTDFYMVHHKVCWTDFRKYKVFMRARRSDHIPPPRFQGIKLKVQIHTFNSLKLTAAS